MKQVTVNGVLYINPDRSLLAEMGVSDELASSIMLEVVIGELRAQRDALLAAAALRLAPLQDAVDLGLATDAEAAQLLAWKGYRVELSRITEQEGYPSVVAWPEPPALS